MIRTKYLISVIISFLLAQSCQIDNQDNIENNPTVPEINYGTMSDIEGNSYKTVKIGSQIWMAENLKTTKYNDGIPIPNISDNTAWTNLNTGAYCWYNNNISFYGRGGALYNWYTVNSNKLCPIGWHVPSDNDWKKLELFLGMTHDEANAEKWRGTDQGIKMKNTSGWSGISNGTNSSGFSAIAAGYRNFQNGGFYAWYAFGNWWSSTEYSSSNAWSRLLENEHSDIRRSWDFKNAGLNIRCLKD